MKKIFLIAFVILSLKNKAQNNNTDPNPPPTIFTGTLSPTQSGPPYDGANPVIPNTSTVTPPPTPSVPNSPINSTDPTNPANTISPGTPTTNVGPKQFQKLFQNPMRSPKNSTKASNSENLNRNFVKSSHHLKTSKSHNINNYHPEKTKQIPEPRC